MKESTNVPVLTNFALVQLLRGSHLGTIEWILQFFGWDFIAFAATIKKKNRTVKPKTIKTDWIDKE